MARHVGAPVQVGCISPLLTELVYEVYWVNDVATSERIVQNFRELLRPSFLHSLIHTSVNEIKTL